VNVRLTRVVLAAAHLDSNPANNRLANLKGLCQRCHILHDRPFHLAQRWLTYRRRRAIGDLFLGLYDLQALPLALFALAAHTPAFWSRRMPPHSYPTRSRRMVRSLPQLFVEASPG